MELTIGSTRCYSIVKSIGAATIMLALSACATSSPMTSANQQAADIQSLRQAEQEDLNRANNPNTPAVAQVDLYAQAVRAHDEIAKLEHGLPATTAEVARASAVPDGELSEPQRAELIAKLKEARTLADRGAYDHDDNPILTEDFIEQGNRIDEAMANLQSGEAVHQSDLEAALNSPAFP
ncbi:MAG TPA: hypothetical protein VMA09_05355 [Candidatus Binataceae bacterium]|nr:hypothetical protein [Candidatus Binataceae bacterium]